MQNEDKQTTNQSESKASEMPKKPFSRRKKRRIMIASVVVIIAMVIILWGWSETGNRGSISVSQIIAEEDQIAANASQFCNVAIEVHGIVSDWDGNSSIFHLVDRVNASQFIIVDMISVFPDGFAIGKTIVAKGILMNSLPITLIANGATVGCSSKY